MRNVSKCMMKLMTMLMMMMMMMMLTMRLMKSLSRQGIFSVQKNFLRHNKNSNNNNNTRKMQKKIEKFSNKIGFCILYKYQNGREDQINSFSKKKNTKKIQKNRNEGDNNEFCSFISKNV